MKKKEKRSKKGLTKVLYWLPRVLAIIFTIFLSLFALDVFISGYTLIEIITALVPSIVTAVLTFVAWKDEKIGGLVFIVVSALYLVRNLIFLTVPLLLIGVLFLVYYYKK